MTLQQGVAEANVVPPVNGEARLTLTDPQTWDTNTVYTVAVGGGTRETQYWNGTSWVGTGHQVLTTWGGQFTTSADGTITSPAATILWGAMRNGGSGSWSRFDANTEFLTIAIDGGEYSGAGTAYLWPWNAANAQYPVTGDIRPTPVGSYVGVYNFDNGQAYYTNNDRGNYQADGSNVGKMFWVPTPSATGTSVAYNYWSGGEVIQKDGRIFFSAGECAGINLSFRMMIYDPSDGTYIASGRLQPATPSDNIFEPIDGCTADGYVASDMALDGYGNAYILVRGIAPTTGDGSEWAPTGANGSKAAVTRSYLVRVTPGTHNSGWKYNIVTMIENDPASTDAAGRTFWGWKGTTTAVTGAQYATYGMAFLNGYLYVGSMVPNNLHRVNPMTGYATRVGGTTLTPADVRDLASAQTAYVLTGTVYDDANGNGVIDQPAEAGLPGQTVAIYTTGTSGGWTLAGVQTTGGTGEYSFLVGGKGTYQVRLVQPTISGVNAVQTYASAGVGTFTDNNGVTHYNTVTANCYFGTAGAASGTCAGANTAPYTDKVLPTAASGGYAFGDTATGATDVGIYTTAELDSADNIPDVDFGITTAGSYGDGKKAPFNSTATDSGPVHIQGINPILWLGTTPGNYANGVNDAAANAHSTDDGVFIKNANNTLTPLQDQAFAAGRTYTIEATVGGSSAGLAKVQGWILNATGGTAAAAQGPNWTGTLSGVNSATGTWQAPTQAGGIQEYQARFDASLQSSTITTQDNRSNTYQATKSSTTVPWTTQGEVEDYRIYVAGALVKIAAVTEGGTAPSPFTYSLTNITNTAPSVATDSIQPATAGTPQQSSAVHAVQTVGQGVVISSNSVTNWNMLSTSNCVDSTTGAAVTATVDESAGTISLASVAQGDDITCTFAYGTYANKDNSTLTVAKTSTNPGTDVVANESDSWTATATIKDNGSPANAFPGVVVTWDLLYGDGAEVDQQVTNDDATLSDSTCTAGMDGTCEITVTAKTARAYKVVATIPQSGGSAQINGSPAAINFVADEPVTQNSNLVVTTQVSGASRPLVVGTGSTSTYEATVTLKDGNNNAVSGYTVNLGLTKSDGSAIDPSKTVMSAGNCTTNASGQCMVTIYSTEAGNFSLTAKILTAQENVTGSPATLDWKADEMCTTPGTSGITVTPLTQIVGANVDVTVALKDCYGNPIGGLSATQLGMDWDGLINNGPMTETGTNTGVYTGTATTNTVDTYTIKATPTASNANNSTIEADPVTFTSSGDFTATLAVDPNSAYASDQAGAAITATVTVTDTVGGNAITGLTASAFSWSASPNTLQVTDFAEVGSGVYTFKVWSNKADLYTLQTTVTSTTPAGSAPTNSVQITINPRIDNVTVSVVANPDAVNIGQESTVTIIATDTYGNKHKGLSAADFTTLSYGGMTVSTPFAESTGVDVGEYTVGLTSASTGTFTVSATYLGETGSAQITVGTGDLSASLVLTGSPAEVGLPTSTGITATITVQNNAGQPVIDLAESAFNFTSNTAVNVSNYVNNNNGTYTFKLTSTTTGVFAITGNVNGTAWNSQNAEFYAGPINWTNSKFAVSPDSLQVGNTAVATLTLVDNWDNPVTGQTPSLSYVPASTSGVLQVSAMSEQTGANAGKYSWNLSTSTADTYNLTATGPGGTKPASVTFRFGEVSDLFSYINAAPIEQVAGQNITLTVHVADVGDNPITGLNSTDFVIGAYATSAIEAPNTSYETLTATTFAEVGNGNYTFQIRSNLVGHFRVTAVVDGVTLTRTPTINWIAGDVCVQGCSPIMSANTTKIEMTNNDALANGIATNTATAYAYDTYGNRVPNAPVIVNQVNGNGELNPQVNQVNTNTSGVANLSWTSTTPGEYQGQATVQGKLFTVATGLESIRFITDPLIDFTKSTLVVTPASPLTAGNTYTLTATLVNSLDQPINGVYVTFGWTNGPADASTLNTVLSNTSCQTTGTGANAGKCSVTFTGQIAGNYTLSATAPGQSGQTNLNGSPAIVTYNAGPVSALNSTADVTLDNQKADGVAYDEITITARDSFGNLTNGTFDIVLPSGSNLTASTNSVTTTNGVGTVRFTTTMSGSHDAYVRYSGTNITGGNPAKLNFSRGNIDVTKSTLSISPAGPIQVGQTYTVTATAVDQASTPVPDEVITFTGPADLQIPTSSCTTNSQGQCTISVTSYVVGSYTITGWSGSNALSNTVSAQFTVGDICVPSTTSGKGNGCVPVIGDGSKVEVIHNGAANDGVEQNIAKVTAVDKYNNPIQGAVVRSTSTDSNLTIQPNDAGQIVTASDGTANIWYTSTVASDTTANVTVSGFVLHQSPISLGFGGNVIDPTKSTFTISPAGPLVVGTGSANTYTVTITARDRYDALVSNGYVELSIDPLGTEYNGNSYCRTNAQGVCTIQVYSTKAGAFSIQPKANGVNFSQTAESRSWKPDAICGAGCTPVTTDQSLWTRLTVEKDNSLADGASTNTVRAYAFDKYGNAVEGASVSVTPQSGSGMTTFGNPANINSNGYSDIQLRTTKAGSWTASVTMTDDVSGKKASNDPATVTFKAGEVCIGPGKVPESYVSNANRTRVEVTHDGEDYDSGVPNTATAYAFDCYGNPVSGATVTAAPTSPMTVSGSIPTTDTNGASVINFRSTLMGTYTAAVEINGYEIEWQGHATETAPSPIPESPVSIFFDGPCIAELGCVPDDDVPNNRRSRVEVIKDNQVVGEQGAAGVTPDEIHVYIFNKKGEPRQGEVISTTVLTGDMIPQAAAVQPTDVNGRTVITYNSKVAGSNTAGVYLVIASGSYNVTFTPQPIPPATGPAPDNYKSSPVTLSFQSGPPCLPSIENCEIDPSVPNDKRSRVVVNPNYGLADGSYTDTANVYLFDKYGNPSVGYPIKVAAVSASLNVQAHPTLVADASGLAQVGLGSLDYSVAQTATAKTTVNGTDHDVIFTPQPQPPATGPAPSDYQSSPFEAWFLRPGAVPPPVITSPASGALVNTATPTISGTGEVGATISVKDGATEICTTTVGASGEWSCTSSTLSEGQHTITATQTDTANNTSLPSSSVTFTIDTRAPSSISITTPTEGQRTNVVRPTISGVTSEANATVVVNHTVKGELCRTTANANGNWSCVSEVTLDEGDQTITATAFDAATNSKTSDPRNFVIDTVPPNGDLLVIIVPAANAIVSDNTPRVSGTADADQGGRVIVTLNGTELCRSNVALDGTWGCDSSHLADGTYTINAVQEDEAGNRGGSKNRTFTIDTAKPDAPGITSPRTGDKLNDATPEITGTGEPGATVTVKDQDNNVVCTATVNASSQWSCTPTEANKLDEGSTTLTATQNDGANDSDGTSVTITVDTIKPDVPVITTPTAGEKIGTPTITVTGTAEPGSEVFVSTGPGGATCTTTAATPSGAYSCNLTGVPDGNVTITVTATDDHNNTSDPATVSVTKDTVAPTPPTVTSPQPGDLVDTKTPTVTGTAEPGSTVTVKDDTGQTLCTATANAAGAWSCTVESGKELPEDTNKIVVTATDPTGNESAPTEVEFNVDTVDPSKPVITKPSDGEEVSALKPEFAGTGEAGATVTVKDETGTELCKATVQADGSWSCTSNVNLGQGDHTVTVTQTDPTGNTSEEETRDFVVDTIPPTKPIVTKPADGEELNTEYPVIEGKDGEPGNTITVTDEHGRDICTAVVQADGTWSCTSNESFTEGDHELTVIETDKAGNESPPTVVEIVSDYTAPDAPTVTKPAEGQSVPDKKPEFAGTAEPGSTVKVEDESGNELCKVVVDASGNWSCTSTVDLPDGDHKVIVTATDPAGNVSDPIEREFNVDTVAPQPPVVDPSNGTEISGSTDPSENGSSVVITDKDGNPIPGCENVVVDQNGNFSCTPTNPVKDGEEINVVIVDPAGNESDKVTITVAGIFAAVKYPSRVQGEEQVVSGHNFKPGERVTGTVHSDPVSLGTVIADADGLAAFPAFNVPADFEPGEHTVVVRGETSGQATVTFIVEAAAPIQSGLAGAGSMVYLAGVGLALLSASFLMMLLTKKRREEEEEEAIVL